MEANTQCIFFSGSGNIPADILAKLIYEHEDTLIRTTADVKWELSDPQIRFELKVSRDEAEDIVSNLNDDMESRGIDIDTNGGFWLADE